MDQNWRRGSDTSGVHELKGTGYTTPVDHPLNLGPHRMRVENITPTLRVSATSEWMDFIVAEAE
jgi:hypothetical protein